MNGTGQIFIKQFILCISMVCSAYAVDRFVIDNADTNTVGTLRFAINQAVTGDTIKFALPPGQLTITLTSNLPFLQVGVLVDGTTQPGFAGTPVVTITGTNAISGFSLLGSDTIQGLAINSLGSAITSNTGNDLIQGNYIGTDTTGTIALGNGSGIVVAAGSNTIIRNNLIVANTTAGIILNGPLNTITENLIGTNSAASLTLGNAIGVIVGATGLADQSSILSNTISGNTVIGVLINTGITNTLVSNNFIGTDSIGRQIPNSTGIQLNQAQDTALSMISNNAIAYNTSFGIAIVNSNSNTVTKNHIYNNGIFGILLNTSSNNLFGGTFVDANTITKNGFSGIVIGGMPTDASIGNTITFNSIFDNGNVGIDLGQLLFPKPNVPVNPVPGTPNNSQNFPVLSNAQLNCDNATVTFSLHSVPNTGFTIQFFSNSVDRNPLITEGETFIGEVLVVTDALGDAIRTVSFLPVACVAPGSFISGTATNMDTGDTSEFSFNVPVTLLQGADLSITKQTAQCTDDKVLFTISVFNNGPCPATNVVVSDCFPCGIEIDNIKADGWNVSLDKQCLTATLATLNPGAAPDIIICARAKCKEGVLVNCASVKSVCTPDPDLSNNSAFSSIQCPSSKCDSKKK